MPLNDEKMAEVLSLLEHADKVELKVMVPDRDRHSAIAALDIEVLEAEIRQVIFFDTPSLKLNRSGVVVRARRSRSGGDTVIKLRPFVPSEFPGKLRRSSGFSVELDAMPGTFVCSASLKGKADNSAIKQVVRGEQPVRSLFSSEQRALYKKHAPANLDLDSLMPLGPINLLRLKFSPQGFKRQLVAEAWFYPDGTRILELSTKCAPEEAFHFLAETRTFLKRRGINLTSDQETKTRKALEYFSRLHAGKRTSQRAA